MNGDDLNPDSEATKTSDLNKLKDLNLACIGTCMHAHAHIHGCMYCACMRTIHSRKYTTWELHKCFYYSKIHTLLFYSVSSFGCQTWLPTGFRVIAFEGLRVQGFQAFGLVVYGGASLISSTCATKQQVGGADGYGDGKLILICMYVCTQRRREGEKKKKKKKKKRKKRKGLWFFPEAMIDQQRLALDLEVSQKSMRFHGFSSCSSS
jgi:hypothetical protein